jgi:hypothetical protein
MLLDLYQALTVAGFPLNKYHYIGFGSIFFVDFKILHKLLGIQKMTSIEGFQNLWVRCNYNKPFSNITMFPGLSSDYLPGVSKDELYLIWFDYDFPVNEIAANDIMGLCASVRPWSLLFFTVDLEKAEEMANDLPESFFDYFSEQLPDFAMADLSIADFKPPVREQTIVSIVERCIKRGLKGRRGITFETLVRLTYADGHRMLTIGGMIADDIARQYLSGTALADLWFLSRGTSGAVIDMPKLVFTPKEITVLEQCFPDGSAPATEMGVEPSEIESLRKLYRYWPAYTEHLT